jgi:hypothetical protein
VGQVRAEELVDEEVDLHDGLADHGGSHQDQHLENPGMRGGKGKMETPSQLAETGYLDQPLKQHADRGGDGPKPHVG